MHLHITLAFTSYSPCSWQRTFRYSEKLSSTIVKHWTRPLARESFNALSRRARFKLKIVSVLQHNSRSSFLQTSVNIIWTTLSAGPYLEEDLVVANPAGDHVSSWHLPIRREAEPDISQRTHLNFERDIFCTGSPEHWEVGIQIYRVGPVGAGHMPQP